MKKKKKIAVKKKVVKKKTIKKKKVTVKKTVKPKKVKKAKFVKKSQPKSASKPTVVKPKVAPVPVQAKPAPTPMSSAARIEPERKPLPKIGEKAPGFTLQDSFKSDISLNQFAGKNVVIYFYPKDDTPGCTTEGIQFTEKKSEFNAANTVILGISADTCESHAIFIAKFALGITLLSDTTHSVLEAYGVWRSKGPAENRTMGISRTTFLVGPDGLVKYIWEHVNPEGHADAVLAKIKGG